MRRHWLAAALLAAALGAGCGSNKYNQTRVVVHFSGERMLHVATVPRVMPDGSEPSEQRAALLEEVAQRAGGYTYIEGAAGDWQRLEDGQMSDEPNNLLLVHGPPQIGLLLRDRLVEDFKQPRPVVVSIPSQSVAWVPVSEKTSRSERRARASGTE